MTIGIGVVCHHATCVVMASDAKGSFEGGAFPSNERTGKQMPLPFRMCANIAGTVSVCSSLLNRLASVLDTIPPNSDPAVDAFYGALQFAKYGELWNRVDDQMATTLMMRLDDWRRLPSPSLQYRRGQKLINRYELPVQLMIGGFAKGNGFILTSTGNATPEIGWLDCIGIGGDAAFARLMQRSQNPHMTLPRCLVHLAEAMADAETANPTTVGPMGDYVVISRTSLMRLPSKDPTVKDLIATYDGRDTEDLDKNKDVLAKIQAALYAPGTTKEEYESGLRAPQSKVTQSAAQTSEGQQ
jgi:hypothetical protein